MIAIILQRREIPDASLLLKVLSENGKIEKLKIPGILKSKSRNSFFLAPATTWNFTISGNPRQTMTPREFSLTHAPFDFNSNYRDLLAIGEILKPLSHMKPELEIQELFYDLNLVLSSWICGDQKQEDILLNQFYLNFLKHMGLLHYSMECIACGEPIKDGEHYHLFSGSICVSCLHMQAYKMDELIPNQWLKYYLGNMLEISTDFNEDDSRVNRQKILMFLAYSV